MRYLFIAIFMVFMLVSCGGGRSVVVDPPVVDPPVVDPPVVDPPVDNPVVKLTLTTTSTAGNELEVMVTGGTEPYMIKVSEPTGLLAEITQAQSLDGQATFTFTATQPVMGGGGLCFITAEDANGARGITDTFLGIDAVPILDTIQLNDDTLYAIPQRHEVKVGEPVRILIATGRTAHSFQFLLGAGVVIDGGGRWVFPSNNVGTIGGLADTADGVWSTITSDGGFILGPDMLFGPGADPENTLPADAVRYDFNVSPLGGSDQESVYGALINFQVEYSRPGLKRIGFQEFNGVNRTFYGSLGDGEFRSWSVLMADEMGNLHPSVIGQVDNTILVTE